MQQEHEDEQAYQSSIEDEALQETLSEGHIPVNLYAVDPNRFRRFEKGERVDIVHKGRVQRATYNM